MKAKKLFSSKSKPKLISNNSTTYLSNIDSTLKTLENDRKNIFNAFHKLDSFNVK